jgi:hypothetical protein
MSSYSIVLAPIAALMAIDFFVVKHQKLDIYELYKPEGIYRFSRGWNWRSYIALACAVAPNLPGMVAAINSSVNIGGVRYVYMISNIAGDFSEYTSSSSYAPSSTLNYIKHSNNCDYDPNTILLGLCIKADTWVTVAIVVYLALNKFFPARESLVDVAVHEVIDSDDADYRAYVERMGRKNVGNESKGRYGTSRVDGVVGQEEDGSEKYWGLSRVGL